MAYLEPYIRDEQSKGGQEPKPRGTIVLATVKGDVHDIGKNIVGVVLGCNNYRVIDLGVMVPCEKILETAEKEQADFIGLSGLITPSLDQMVHVAREMQRRAFRIPLLIGGATTSAKHTAVKIAPEYKQPVVHVPDASRCVSIVERLLNPTQRDQFVEENRRLQSQLVASFNKQQSRVLIPYKVAVEKRFRTDWNTVDIPEPAFIGKRVLEDYPLEELANYIDWTPFFWVWEIRGKFPRLLEDPKVGNQARQLYDDARRLLDMIIEKKLLVAKGTYGFWPACSVGDDIYVYADKDRNQRIACFHTLRQQSARPGREICYALADFIAPAEVGRCDYIGAFAVTAGHGCQRLVEQFQAKGDDYRAIMAQALADRLAEAFAERLHEIARADWGYGKHESLTNEDLIAERYRGIRPAPGYPAQPDHTEKVTLFRLLDVPNTIGVRLTETMAMDPPSSVCGLYFAHPESKYFAVDRIGRDQVEQYARRKGMSVEEVERWLEPYLAYNPKEAREKL